MFPEELKNAISAINHNIRWRIVELIKENGRMAYTELYMRLGVRKGSLNYHLDALMESGLLDNYASKEFGSQYNSYYEFSRFGKDFVEGILSSIVITQFAIAKEGRPELLRRGSIDYNTQKYVGNIGPQGVLGNLMQPEYHLSVPKNEPEKKYESFIKARTRKTK